MMSRFILENQLKKTEDMKFRKFGSTDLVVSEIGFGAWGIGGPSMAGDIAIGWGKVDDSESIRALKRAANEGIIKKAW